MCKHFCLLLKVSVMISLNLELDNNILKYYYGLYVLYEEIFSFRILNHMNHVPCSEKLCLKELTGRLSVIEHG